MPGYTTVRDVLKSLLAMVEKDPTVADLPVFTIHGASGVSDEIVSFHERCGPGDTGPLCDLRSDERYVSLYIGN